MKKYTISIAIGIIGILLAPFILTRNLGIIDFSDTGNVGETIEGTTAPIIGILSILLLVYTLMEQIKFNKSQREISMDEQFKSTFFNLLQTQRNILEKISGEFTHLGSHVNMKYSENDNNETFKIKKRDKDWAIIEKKSKIDVRGLDFFKFAKYQLQDIFDALESTAYYKKYDPETADDIETEITELYEAMNLYQEEGETEFEKTAQEKRKPLRIGYVNEKYNISKELHKKYLKMEECKKLALGYAYFYNKYENIGYYFRHLYRILKFIKNSEDEKISLRGKNASKKETEKIHDQYQQYAQFIQAQMSIDELLLLFYNSFLYEKTQNLIIHYDLLENLSIQNLIYQKHNCIPQLKLKNNDDLFSSFNA